MKYMIHACPQRMWYVNDYLIPSMRAQGIEDIEVWNDTDGKGNLFSCMEAFRACGERAGGTWHLQCAVAEVYQEKPGQKPRWIVR